MEGYDLDMLTFDKQSTDARLQAYLAAQSEQTRVIQANATIGGFANTAQAQKFAQGVTVQDFANNTLIRSHEIAVNLASFINSVREAKRNELLVQRSQELNELQTMIHGGQVQIPQFQGFVPGHVADTPLSQSVYASAGINQQNYASQQQQQGDLWGGLLGAAGTLIGGPLGGAAGGALGSILGGR